MSLSYDFSLRAFSVVRFRHTVTGALKFLGHQSTCDDVVPGVRARELFCESLFSMWGLHNTGCKPMIKRSMCAVATAVCALAFVPINSTRAQSPGPELKPSPTENGPTAKTSVEGTYQGTLVCEQMPYAAGPLRAPLDISVTGNTAKFARPIFTLDGGRVVGSEVGSGSLDQDGTLHLVSNWVSNNTAFEAKYDGVITPKGGVLSGVQSWVLGGEPHARPCFAAIVKARVEPPTR
jgi:hypothetical protein